MFVCYIVYVIYVNSFIKVNGKIRISSRFVDF